MSTLQAVIFEMSEQRPTFVARKNPGSGWGCRYSMARWRDGSGQGFHYRA